VDEEGDLTRALHQLLADPAAARAMGGRARDFVLDTHCDARTLETYDQLLKASVPR
jgi:hypothetical protein